ncbi:Helix-turn-helix domain-containing protein [Cetobacterium ceti]|uniref:Helix-turn-helix domain-containing protein n=1 Tax=Cetobacterium ceti TaxID=180163 RepID=A0A1T4LVE6_9FUSO|nr:helix-turn-helix domain-containing protein [Cetobacterium ceti]SJZ58468.1 Helix-turn-helix domain-containing protein [Cetobacterium ceti]
MSFFKIKEVAGILNLSQTYISALLEENLLAGLKIGGRIFILEESVGIYQKYKKY